MKRVSWAACAAKWKSSKGARKITESAEIREVLELLNVLSDGVPPCGFFGSNALNARNMMVKDSIADPLALLEHAASQLAEHGLLWETHLAQKAFKTFEFPFAPPGGETFRYFKVQVQTVKGVWPSNRKLKTADVSYHVSAEAEVRIEYES